MNKPNKKSVQAVKFLLAAFLCGVAFSGQAQQQSTSENVDEARQILKVGMESGNPDVRIQAISSVSMVGKNDNLRNGLETSLQDKDPDVRIAAIKALTDLKSENSVPALKKVLDEDKMPEVAFAAAKALYTLQAPEGKQALLDVYNGERQASSGKLTKEKQSFLKHFRSVQSSGMFLVATGLGFVPVPGAGAGFTAMVDLASDENLSPRAATLLLLGKEKDTATDNLLKRALTDKDWSVRAAAAQMIAYTGRSQMREALVPLLDDTEQKVRFRAAGAYLHLTVTK